MRRLKSLRIFRKEETWNEMKWILEKLNRIERFLMRLEISLRVRNTHNRNLQEIFQNKNLFAHLTSLSLSVGFYPSFAEILQICQNLKALLLDFTDGVNEKSEFLNLVASMQHLNQLKSLEFSWPRDVKNCWSLFKPPPSLRQLTLRLEANQLINEDDLEPKDVVGHWEDIKELDVLELVVSSDKAEEIRFMRLFITMILKKVHKLRSLKLSVASHSSPQSPLNYEPFIVEEVSHLFESLEAFECSLHDSRSENFSKFDLLMMKPFRNLKELKYYGYQAICENVQEAVVFLEANQKGGGISLLEIKIHSMVDKDWLKETLWKMKKIKRNEKDLKIKLDLKFKQSSSIDILEDLCRDIQDVKPIKGLEICLELNDGRILYSERLKRSIETLKKCVKISNLRVVLRDPYTNVECIKVGGKNTIFNFSICSAWRINYEVEF